AGTTLPTVPATTATAAYAAAGTSVATAAGMAASGGLAGAQYVAAGPCPTLGERPSQLGAAWRLRRLLHSPGPLHPVLRESALVPDAQPSHDVHGIPALLV